ncbi:MAG: formate dehydrogenase accessory sulfurtransferase FdhD [Acetobacteraceae bacterium]|nr:formate dehydrogenase accessory sulfurtransferase FdhD [Acetobacteraceae bacterium]
MDAPPATTLLIRTEPGDARLTRAVAGIDHTGSPAEGRVPEERALSIYLNGQEIVTAMTIGDHPEHLAVGFLLNQGMLAREDRITAVDFDSELMVVVVRTGAPTNYEHKLRKRTQTSGCAQGTSFGDLMEKLEGVTLPPTPVRTSALYRLLHTVNTMPSIYLEAGAIHGCVLAEGATPLAYFEDVGRHNAVDKLAGWMWRAAIPAGDKLLYTTGRLTSEMVIKTVRMGIPTLVSRSGFTAWGVDLARQAGLTLIGRARGRRFLAVSGAGRIVFDADPSYVADESAAHRRKAAGPDD